MKTPIQRFTADLTYKGDHLEIIGEVYDQPIKITDNVQPHTQIQFICKKIEVAPTLYFSEQLSFFDLKKNVIDIKRNIKKYL